MLFDENFKKLQKMISKVSSPLQRSRRSQRTCVALSSLINKHACLFFPRKKIHPTRSYIDKQHQILPTRLLNLKKKFQPTRLFQPARLLES